MKGKRWTEREEIRGEKGEKERPQKLQRKAWKRKGQGPTCLKATYVKKE
jgi:hypothetical protein